MIFESLTPYLQNLFLILSVFIIGAASPGPATLMILNTGVTSGRRSSVALSLGIVTGSAFWGGCRRIRARCDLANIGAFLFRI
jgi:spore maturation protein SpmA